ncbi:MBL fold metallo-hydrolase [Chungangia koreensis]|uniref:MBL fold metallo-hydrolase n=1 Tax=Chungangia koreensis TaxID=752657 RepID=A0ABV8WZG2_9LACT
MDYLLQAVRENVYAFAVWDTSWGSYNNCYIVLEEDGVTLIDCGKKEHAQLLVDALQSLSKTPDDVTVIIATHGHEDHVQGIDLFAKAVKYIHIREEGAIEVSNSDRFTTVKDDSGIIGDFTYALVGTHSPGSMVVYHRPTKILFSGDFLCYFGDPLSNEGFISNGMDLRQAWLDFMKEGGVASKELSHFLSGLRIMKGFDADALCTGHGGILTGEIGQFFGDLLACGE